jgi:hypothetical protein
MVRRWPLPLKIVNGVFTLLFLLGAIVQINDPDPVLWIAIYLAAMAATAIAPWKPRPGRVVAVAVLVLSVAWAVAIFSHGMGPITLHELVTDLRMKTEIVELWRESLGLLIMAAWMAVVVVAGRPRSGAEDQT